MSNNSINAQVIKYINGKVKGSKVVGSEISTGYTWFEGRRRLAKVVKHKDTGLLELEVNVAITYEDPEYKHLTRDWAKAHHYGTCEGILRTRDIDKAKAVIDLAVEAFRKA
jgi:hypothetical protein